MAGLAYVNPNMEMYKLKMEQERAAMEERKQAYAITKDLADMWEVGKVDNAYDHQKQTQFANERLAYIGKYITQNPDFLYDPSKFMYVKGLSRELKDNKWTRRSDTYKENTKAYLDAIKAHPELMNSPEYQRMAIQLGNRANFGSIEGDDSEQEFIYQPSFQWNDDWMKDLQLIAKGIPRIFKADPSRGDRGSGGWMVPNPTAVDKVLNAYLGSHMSKQLEAMYSDPVDRRETIKGMLEGQVEDVGPVNGWFGDREAQLELMVEERKAQIAAGNEPGGPPDYDLMYYRQGMMNGETMAAPPEMLEEITGKSGEFHITSNVPKFAQWGNHTDMQLAMPTRTVFGSFVPSNRIRPAVNQRGEPVYEAPGEVTMDMLTAYEAGILVKPHVDEVDNAPGLFDAGPQGWITEGWRKRARLVTETLSDGTKKIGVKVEAAHQFVPGPIWTSTVNNFHTRKSNTNKAALPNNRYNQITGRGQWVNTQNPINGGFTVQTKNGMTLTLSSDGRYVMDENGNRDELKYTKDGRQIRVTYDPKRNTFVDINGNVINL